MSITPQASRTMLEMAKDIFDNANDVRRSSIVLMRAMDFYKALNMQKEGQFLTNPQIVLAAFSSELYLKCLIRLDGKNPPQNHKLFSLYERLQREIRKELDAFWMAEVASKSPMFERDRTELDWRNKLALPVLLKASSEAFIHWRYYYEYKPIRFCLPNFQDVLHNFIVSKHPWAEPVTFP